MSIKIFVVGQKLLATQKSGFGNSAVNSGCRQIY